ncbi:MAG: tetratricopeptide repeat protein [Myxococcota bacterium]|nr:tetratricopeptide repeat protein [Myxococcota bacterium]
MSLRRALPVIAACAATLLLTACQDDQARLAEHLERAEAYLEEEKPSEAVIEYKNALQIDPNDASAHYGLAKAYMATRQVRKAYWELQETVRLDPANNDARLAYGQFLLLGRDEELDQALEQGDAVIASEPDQWEAHILRGRALEGLKRLDEAQQAYERGAELDPENADLVRLLANFHVRKGSRDAAGPLYVKLTEMAPTAPSYFALGSFLAQDRERDSEAEAAYRKALEVATDEERAGAYRRLASFFYARERFDEAESTLQQGIESTEGDLDVIYAMARYYHSRGAPDKADAMIQEATRAQPDEVRPFLILSAYRGRNDDLEGALEAAESALAIDPQNQPARLRKAELLVDLGVRGGEREKLAQGRAIVDAVLAADESAAEAHFVRAKIDLGEGKPDEATAALRRALDGRPDWAQAHFLLASSLLLQGDRQEARAEVLRAVELDAEFLEARRLAARIHAALAEHDLAVEEARKILRQRPGDHTIRILLAQSLVHLGKPDEARAELDAIPLDERDAEVHFALGRIDMMQRKPEFAREKLIQALEQRPNHPEILESLLNVEAQLGQIDQSLARIEQAAAEEPDNPKLVRLHGIALLFSGKGSLAEAKLRRAIDLDPNDIASYQALARYLISSRRFSESIETYKRAVDSRPDFAPLRFTLGTLYEVSGDRELAIEQYEEAVRLNPGLAVAKNNLAYLMVEEGKNLDRALDLAQEAKALLPDSPNAADTLGWVLLKKGIPEAAIGYLKEAEGGFPPGHDDLGVVRYHLALAYEANQEQDKARETLERALGALEASRGAAEQAGQEAPADPAWVADVRSMLERL